MVVTIADDESTPNDQGDSFGNENDRNCMTFTFVVKSDSDKNSKRSRT